MKNIHLLETIKVSKLHFDDKLFLSTNYQLSKGINSIVEGRNIYITNLEKTKLGEWVIYTNGIKIHCQKLDNKEDVELANIENSGVLKIILTTDQDLIEDGVQTTPDDFLEWFIKNPSCEEVDVKNPLIANISDFGYKITIPKEQQSTKDRILSETPDEVKQRVRDRANSLVNNRESLEEACERLTQDYNGDLCQKLIAKTFITVGVKWQQEEDKGKFNKEDLREAYRCGKIYDMTSFDDWFEQLTKVKQTSS